MILNGVKCESCDNMHKIDFVRHMSMFEVMPDHWFSMYKGREAGAEQCMHFCSIECLSVWVKDHLPKALSPEVGQEVYWKDL